ncbi:MAG: hypothetical protein ABSF46_02930 [Terriglobia bacterium]|jgi:hypothetical protein
MPTNATLIGSAERLHSYLYRTHYRDGILHGPDPGVRFNLRAWRFLKSAFDFIPWGDDYVFMQTQGYWVLTNWQLFEATGEAHYREIAIRSSEATLALETDEGYWKYPLPERRHLIATLEGIWGGTALLATYCREARSEFLDGALRAYRFIVNRIGFQDHTAGKVINYFDKPRGKVTNNSVIAAWYFLRLWEATQEERYLEHVGALLDFAASAQLPSGELPYIIGNQYEQSRPHYLCFQYNAFQFLHLAWSNAVRPGRWAEQLIPKLAGFLATGVQPTGACAKNCRYAAGGGPEVDYYTGAMAAALHEARRSRLSVHPDLIDACYNRLLAHQRSDGGFDYSYRDYGFLSDHRSYPRYLAMTLFHLLYPACGNGFEKA